MSGVEPQSEIAVARATESAPVRVQMPIRLRPIMDSSVAELICTSPHVVMALVKQYGSPLNILWPDLLRQNIEALCLVLQQYELRYELFYAAKVNKSEALVRMAIESGIGVDVSSVYEMRGALSEGIDPARLCVTGPAKTSEFHTSAIAQGARISVDSIEEWSDLEQIMSRSAGGRSARLLLRYRPAASRTSRFGMDAEEVTWSLRRLAGLKDRFILEGFHFHLAGYDIESRVQAIRELSAHVLRARDLGLDPKVIDIGGGLPVRYVDVDIYEGYLRGQGSDDYRTGRIPESFYPYGSELRATEWLNELLSAPCVDGLSVASYLHRMHLTLAIEPGRSLVDQCAVSVFKVTRVKRLINQTYVVFVEGSSFSACETWFGSEFLVDPILISTAGDGAPVQAWIAGHSCLDDDVLTNRLIEFDTTPRAGDLLVFANTAGYQMDLLENEFHRYPMPRRVAVTVDGSGRIAVSPDDWKG